MLLLLIVIKNYVHKYIKYKFKYFSIEMFSKQEKLNIKLLFEVKTNYSHQFEFEIFIKVKNA